MKTRIRFHLIQDIYTHSYLTSQNKTIEHLLPCSKMKHSRGKNDILHLFITSYSMNKFRSNYIFGGCIDEIQQDSKNWQEKEGNFRNKSKMLFYPKKSQRLIAHVHFLMLNKYPDLRDLHFFDSWDTLDKWSRQKWTEEEKFMWESKQFFAKN
jgi:hypothetical protein